MNMRPIKNEDDYRDALLEIETLMSARSDTEAGDRLDALVTLVEDYERAHHHPQRCDSGRPLHAELIQRGLAGPMIEGGNEQSDNPRKKCDALDALFAAGDELASSGVDVSGWAAHSREVWR